MKNPCSLIAAAIVAALVLVPIPVLAQSSRTGPTFPISSGYGNLTVMLPDVAYDSVHDRYLSVSEIGHVIIDAQVLDAQGARIAAVRVRASGLGAQNPRVAFSPDVNNGAGGYLVTWHESTSGVTTQVWGKLISADGAILSGEIAIGLDTAAGVRGTSSNWLMGAAVGYATGSHEFLVSWMGGYGGLNDIRFMRLNVNGSLLQSGAITITAGTPDWERDPAIAYNPQQDEFYIAYAGWVNSGNYGFVAGQRVKAGTGALIGGPRSFGAFSAPQIPSVSYSAASGQYLVAWYNATSTSRGVYGAMVRAADGAISGDVRVISGYFAAYDALDIDYNPTTQDYLLVTHSQTIEDAAVSIKGDGYPVDNGFILTNTPDVRPILAGDGNYNPRVVASAWSGRYLTVTAAKFTAIHAQFATSVATGGVTPPPPPPPPPATSNPKIFLDSPAPSSLVQPNFSIGGWAVDLGAAAGSGSGIATVHVWAFPTNGAAGIFLGAVNMGVGRPDIAAYFGRSDFSSAGFSLGATLAPGTYDVNVYAFSTLAGKFNASAGARVTVTQPLPNPKMFIDSPVPGQLVSGQFMIGGWAVDLGAPTGSGVAVLHVWAYPLSGAAPVFVGATTPNVTRPDVGAYFGSGRFSSSGYSLQGNLPPGAYKLVVFAFSTVTGTFNQAAAVVFTVQ
jgi:hypothetical protein